MRGFTSVVRGHDDSIIAAGWCEFGNGTSGLLVKLRPEIMEPQFISWAPEDTVFCVLPGDSVTFMVEVSDQQSDSLRYLWRMGEDTLSREASDDVGFDELGQFDVSCRVSDGEVEPTITWHVTCCEFYIDAFRPDSLDLTVRRGTDVDFILEVRAIEGLECGYYWEHSGRGGDFQIEAEDSLRYAFDLTGEHAIFGAATHDQETRAAEWNVTVRSVVWWWFPHELDLVAPVDSTVEFEVFPFDEESDSLVCLWSAYGRFAGEGTTLRLRLNELGFCDVVAVVTEGEEADTVAWRVEVVRREFTAEDADYADYPSELTLYAPAPNPFNARATVRYFLPEANDMTLRLYDLNGREVPTLVEGRREAGFGSVAVDAADWPAGTFFLALESGGRRAVKKMVVVR